jgi:hypothetical protein
MKVSNYVFFVIGVILFILGINIEHYHYIFNEAEAAGYFGHFIFILGMLVFLFQFIIWGLKLIVLIFKEIKKNDEKIKY